MTDAIETAARVVLDTFRKDEAEGYRSRDRQYAIDVLGRVLDPIRPTPLRCLCLGFKGWPEDALSSALNHMEANGAVIVNVSVVAESRSNGETHSAYVVCR